MDPLACNEGALADQKQEVACPICNFMQDIKYYTRTFRSSKPSFSPIIQKSTRCAITNRTRRTRHGSTTRWKTSSWARRIAARGRAASRSSGRWRLPIQMITHLRGVSFIRFGLGLAKIVILWVVLIVLTIASVLSSWSKGLLVLERYLRLGRPRACTDSIFSERAHISLQNVSYEPRAVFLMRFAQLHG